MGKLRIKQRYIDDLLVLLMFCVSGNPAFTNIHPLGKIIYGLMLIVVLVASGFRIKMTALRQCAFWSLLLAVIFGAQFLLLGQITYLGSLNYLAKMLSAILFASLLGTRLSASAIRVMSIVCLISLPFYFINLLGVRFESPFSIGNDTQSFIIYTQNWDDPSYAMFRNCGMFWEPGAFAGYIIVTLALFADRPKVLWYRFRRSFFLLSFTLLTTFSTTGYITYAVLLFYFILHWGKKGYGQWVAYGLAGVLILGSVFAFSHVDFLGKKIQKELAMTERQTEDDVNPSRSGSFLFDLPYIASHPVFGNGLSAQTRFRFHLGAYDEEDLNGLGNGFSGCIASMGFLFMLAYLIAIGLNPALRAKGIILLVVIMLLQGEYYLNFPFFMMFPFIQFSKPLRPEKAHRRRIRFVWNKQAPVASPS